MSSRLVKTLRRLAGRLHGLERRMHIRPELEINMLLQESEFDQELERQRALAERTRAPIFILQFYLAPSLSRHEDREEAMEVLAEVVRARMRLSDIAGRCNDAVLLILRCARQEGASSVARAIGEAFDERLRPRRGEICAHYLYCEITSYPRAGGAAEPDPRDASDNDLC
jgi:hypothetical protein